MDVDVRVIPLFPALAGYGNGLLMHRVFLYSSERYKDFLFFSQA